MSTKFALTDKVAIVTGGGRGIGKSIARELTEHGARVILAEIDESTGKNASAEISAEGGQAISFVVDVRSSVQVDDMVSKVLDKYKKIDILVNNAGGSVLGKPFLQINEDEWDRVISLNLKTNFLCTRAVGRVMANQRAGCIVNISSMSGLVAYPSGAAYAAAKAAIINMTKTLSVELAPYNIRINSIAPGVIMTALTEEIYNRNPKTKEDRLKSIPMGRLGTPEDIAAVAVFLASDAAGYLTGETLLVGGGINTLTIPD